MESEGRYVAEFIERLCRLTQGARAGDRVKLLPFQRDILEGLFELDDDGRRKHRRAYLQMPRKNGKTFLTAAISLYAAVTSEVAGECYYVAGSRMQASRAFTEVRRIVEQEPELSGLFKLYANHFEIPMTGTILRVLSSEAGLQMGLSPSFVVFDELAFVPDEKLWTAMITGSGTRSQPMIVAITTPGWSKDSPAFKLYQHAKAIEAGLEDDPGFYYRIFEAPAEADHTDPAVWATANPALGHFLHEQDLSDNLATLHELEFRRLRLGQWTELEAAWITPALWDACAGEPNIPDGARGVIVGVDASIRRDSTAVCTLLVTADAIHAQWKVWQPGPDADVPLLEVEQYVRHLATIYPDPVVSYDPRYFGQAAQALEADGLRVFDVPQSDARMVPSTQAVWEAVTTGKLRHGGDEIARRHALAAVVKPTEGGVRISKSRTRAQIDCLSALQFALEAASRAPKARRSRYEDHDLLIL